MYNKVINGLDLSHKLDEHLVHSSDFNKHMHPECELLFFIKGKGSYNVEVNNKVLKPYDVIFIMPGLFHFGSISNDVPYERYVFKFPVSYLPSIIKEEIISRSPFLGSHPHILDIFNETDLIVENYSDEEIDVLIRGIINKIFIDINKNYFSIKNNKQQDIPDVVFKSIKYISNHIKEKITISDISKNINYSISYINDSFKQHLKVSVNKYINYKKIICANEDILSNRLTAIDAAKEYGYMEYSTFYRNFKKIMGHSPIVKKSNV